MYIKEIQISVSKVHGVGPKITTALKNLKINTVGDLLLHWPKDWEDRSIIHPLSAYNTLKKINIRAEVIAHNWFGFGRKKTLKITIKDAEGTLAELICFNRPFLEKMFPVHTFIAVYGAFYWKYGVIQSTSFEIEHEKISKAAVLPVYALTAGVSQNQMRKIISQALNDYARGINCELPKSIQKKYKLLSKMEILHFMHNPTTIAEAQKARDALIFEELFLYEYALGKRSLERRGTLPDINISENNVKNEPIILTPFQKKCINRLAFSLTQDQITCLSHINKDITNSSVMARLLQGDVGSGKTLVAFLACLTIVEKGGQTALMAPTELLARQHAENAAKILEPLGIRLAFLTGNLRSKERTILLKELEKGSIDIIIGTHALFSASVVYKNLQFVIIDEQQRFGVLQRSAIIEKGIQSNNAIIPHLLMMSATPIPRTLTLSMFGDLDISTIKTMPPGRKTIQTHLAVQGKEQKVYDFVGHQINQGKQAYFVYPRIEDSDENNLKSAEKMYQYLQTSIFPHFKIALIHSQVSEEKQNTIMKDFKKGIINILVATSVVEVGVDVPNANCMIIEHAERFGLSALHQLRGRVGRGQEQAYCFLVYAENLTDIAKQRLKIMHETTDGFIIAEKDLLLRGPGDISGVQQSGYIPFQIADPIRDKEILHTARKAAFSYLLETPTQSV